MGHEPRVVACPLFIRRKDWCKIIIRVEIPFVTSLDNGDWKWQFCGVRTLASIITAATSLHMPNFT